jgi:thiamine-phosphate pyrophosphorylase
MIPRLLAISSPEAGSGAHWRRWCGELAAAGVDGLQVRRKRASDQELLVLATEARATAPLTVLVNGRPDIALAAGAHGVHLPAAGLPVAEVRRLLGANLLVGRSTHTPDEVRLARDQGADFAIFGPVFETPSKAGILAARGLAVLGEAVATGLPIVALGGIDATNARQVVESGAWGLAAIRWFENPAVARPHLAALQRHCWQAS